MLTYNVYAIGQTAILEAYNTDDQGDPESPDSPQILLRTPAGTETELSVTEAPVGHIYHRLHLEAAGRYFYRIVTSDDAVERFFVVRASAFADPLP